MKKLILFSIFCFWLTIVNAQVSSNSCIDASNATPITTAGQYTVGTINGDQPPSMCIPNANDANDGEWFRYVPSANYNLTVTSDLAVNGDKDTRFHVYQGTCGNLNCVGGSDDEGEYNGTNGNSYLSIDNFNVIANETYYIVWDNRWNNSENFTFELIEVPSVPNGDRSFTQQNISTSGSKMGVVDMNGDFLDDLITIPTASGVYNLNVYHQQANGSFVASNFTPEAPRAPVWSLAAGDFDGNGYNDIVFGDSNGANVIKANDNGTAYTTFKNDPIFTQRTNFVDINNDGHLDIFICHDTAPSTYYLSDGTGDLTHHQSVAGSGLGGYVSGGNYGSVWIDYDNDRDIDMFMAKCGFGSRDVNEMYRNDGSGNYTEVAPILGLADDIQTWSAAWADFNNDGFMDAFIGCSNGQPHKMMLNIPNPNASDVDNPRVFEDVTSTTNLDAFTASSIEHAPADFDNDGFIDIISGNKILYNNGDMTFSVSSFSVSSGGIGDLNNDGFLDIFNGTIYRNDGNDNNWIKVITIGNEAGGYSNRNGIGARVEINTTSGTQIRDVRSGEGFRYMSSLNTHFGIGLDTEINYIRVYWPSGVVDNIIDPAINSTITINENTTLGLPNTFATDLIIYPNPTKNTLNLNTQENLTDAIYTVFDINGKVVLNSKLTTKNIDVSNLSAGNYILRLISGSAIKSQKFIKN